MSKFIASLICSTCVCCLIGCATVGTKIEQDKVAQIKEGVTTQGEVISLLGNPLSQTLTSDKKIIMMYQYTKVKNRAANFIPVVNLLAGGMDMKQQILQVLIDENGLVEKYIFTNSDSPINSGLLNTE